MLDEKGIDTAPRDDTEIMLWCDDGVWRKARWERDDIWITTDGEMHIKCTLGDAPGFLVARLWAPIVTADDSAAQSAIVSTRSAGPNLLSK
ncbi:hypothetical protein [Devosia nitrariae]|uniref:Uncharacterized protein n=1 Tax=Devosia nitrariae TaxID=2071872 RepID=A0ABQ5W380_9HYPH|nr:hypothetical protein [Devosia nitrariae]GLQ54432.1 hypothetical protein GCM10010862_16910 [Devosia nitrariae]